jgi:hypothetical protein
MLWNVMLNMLALLLFDMFRKAAVFVDNFAALRAGGACFHGISFRQFDGLRV